MTKLFGKDNGKTTHGMYKTKIYNVWNGMRQRCTNPKHIAYKYYGDKGVRYAKKWHKFEGFLEDMGESYQEGLTLDRINGDEGYYKENCRWVTMKEQSINRKNTRYAEHEGKIMHASDMARLLGVARSTVTARMNRGVIKEVYVK